MIHISHGHELGIGLEVFFKSYSLLPDYLKKHFILHIDRESLSTYLNSLNYQYDIHDNILYANGMSLKLKLYSLRKNISPTQQSLESCLNSLNGSDVLITLPTSKDQLLYKEKLCKGYTEFFRAYYNIPEICMTFKAPGETILLVTDHIPLSEVSKTITDNIITTKVSLSLNELNKFAQPIEEVLISGLNPHSGENGLLGTEDEYIEKAIATLEKTYPAVNFIGPIPGDTMHFHQRKTDSQLLVYIYHDQGLAKFKALFQTIGVNQTLGLPFLRLSVDHGTAFDIYGKNIADSRGCYYLLKYALKKMAI